MICSSRPSILPARSLPTNSLKLASYPSASCKGHQNVKRGLDAAHPPAAAAQLRFQGSWRMAQLPASTACMLALSLNAFTTVGADADDRALGWLNSHLGVRHHRR